MNSQTPPRRQSWSDVALKHKIYLLLRIIGVGGCTPRLLGQFDPEQFLRERLVLPEDTVVSTAGGYYGRVLRGPLSILIGFVLLLGYWKGFRKPSEDLAL